MQEMIEEEMRGRPGLLIRNFKSEKKLYEERANEMCKEMSEQMSLLQSTEMARIESLESDQNSANFRHEFRRS